MPNLKEIDCLIKPLLGLQVALSWKGYGSAIFLELGALKPVGEGRKHHRAGEARLAIEWDWRIELESNILFGSSDSGPEIAEKITVLTGSTVESIVISGKVKELEVTFSSGHVLRSMAMLEGDPQWSIGLHNGNYIYVCHGLLEIGEGCTEEISEDEISLMDSAAETAVRWARPVAEPKLGNCANCNSYLPIDGHYALLDYGVCISAQSPFDGRAVNRNSGCPYFLIG